MHRKQDDILKSIKTLKAGLKLLLVCHYGKYAEQFKIFKDVFTQSVH